VKARALLLVGGVAAAVSGCAAFSADGGLGQVQSLTRERLGGGVRVVAPSTDPDATGTAVRELLAQPLTADAAVQVALFNNPRLKAGFAELGIVEADLVQAGRLANPKFVFGNKRSSDATTIDRALVFNLVSLLVRPLATKIATRQFEEAQVALASQTVQLAWETRRAWYTAVAAEESARYFDQVKLAAEAGAELAAQMARVGNFNRLAQMREQAFYADATAQLARARMLAVVARERLVRQLGVSEADGALRLPERLPELPSAAVEPLDAERAAMERRLDVRAARRASETLAANLGLVRATRFVNVLELAYINESNTGEPRQNGYEIEVELPIFDWGDAKLARAEAVYMQSVYRTAEVAVQARSEVRETYQVYRASYDVARHYRDEIVPLRKRIAEENLLRYNGMLIGIFELLADTRGQIASVNGYIEALRDFWIAETELQIALNSGSPEGGPRMCAVPMSAGGGAPGVH
jgi:outer membrane protein TolC